MGKIRPARIISGIVIVFLLVWPLYHISGMLQQDRSKHDAAYLLYQVSLFQVELLSNLLGEAEKASHTGQLSALLQTAYSVNYTHERLLLALNENSLAKLESLPQLLQYLMRLQLGGERVMKQEELDTLAEVREGYNTIYENYAKLMRDNKRKLSASANDNVKKTDQALAELIKDKLIQ